jgi:hypothetical protein
MAVYDEALPATVVGHFDSRQRRLIAASRVFDDEENCREVMTQSSARRMAALFLRTVPFGAERRFTS